MEEARLVQLQEETLRDHRPDILATAAEFGRDVNGTKEDKTGYRFLCLARSSFSHLCMQESEMGDRRRR